MDSEEAPHGALNVDAAAVAMKINYAARMARFGQLQAVGALARKLAKWISLEDKKLCRLAVYIRFPPATCA